MIEFDDTICAVSTPAGVGGIAVVRVSGSDAISTVSKIWKGRSLNEVASHTAHLGTVLDDALQPLDQAVATVYRTPASFTGQDVVEISVHGSRYVQQALLQSLIHAGARLAAPGEFTRRAFLSGKMDLAQAEGVADIIASESRAAQRIALNQMRGSFSNHLRDLRTKLIDLAALLELELDFSEEDVEFASRSHLRDLAIEASNEISRLASSFRTGHAIKSGIPVAIIGATNAGKSSLLNRLLGEDRAIVSDIHGTTRDVIEDTVALGDYTFRLMDTAGLRTTSDTIEQLGIDRSHRAARQAQIVILVIDGSSPRPIDIPEISGHLIVAVNKSDLPPALELSDIINTIRASNPHADIVTISTIDMDTIAPLTQAMVAHIEADAASASSVLVTNARHYEALIHASESIARVIEAIDAGLSGELIAQDIRLTTSHLGEILGEITSTDLLTTIFTRFCIGK